ncbi:hypothetical protein AGMMS49965_02800 [Bacteroidia bacterium]|nr:hypothetical protein AGMMS49965_02800 [Bacteroidia bacterium]
MNLPPYHKRIYSYQSVSKIEFCYTEIKKSVAHLFFSGHLLMCDWQVFCTRGVETAVAQISPTYNRERSAWFNSFVRFDINVKFSQEMNKIKNR